MAVDSTHVDSQVFFRCFAFVFGLVFSMYLYGFIFYKAGNFVRTSLTFIPSEEIANKEEIKDKVVYSAMARVRSTPVHVDENVTDDVEKVSVETVSDKSDSVSVVQPVVDESVDESVVDESIEEQNVNKNSDLSLSAQLLDEDTYTEIIDNDLTLKEPMVVTTVSGDMGADVSDAMVGSLQALRVAAYATGPTRADWGCSGWVYIVFKNAGICYFAGSAAEFCNAWCHSSDRDELKPGMIVAVPTHAGTEAGKIYGHIGIYMGDNLVRDYAGGQVRMVDLDAWIATYSTITDVRWGWCCGVELR